MSLCNLNGQKRDYLSRASRALLRGGATKNGNLRSPVKNRGKRKSLRAHYVYGWDRTDIDEKSCHRSVLNPLLMVVLQDAADVGGQLSAVNVLMKLVHTVQQQDLHSTTPTTSDHWIYPERVSKEVIK